ncbi:Deoxynucleoside kinase, partial [Pseudolycoriella hygida]
CQLLCAKKGHNMDNFDREVVNSVNNPIEGNIGSEKSTVIEYCRRQTNAVAYQKPVELWRNVGGVNLLMAVGKSMIAIYEKETFKPTKVVERSLLSSRYCFFELVRQMLTIDRVSSHVLDHWYDRMLKLDRVRPHAIIYLRTSSSVAYERMRARARPEEGTVALGYLEGLHSSHEHWLRDLQEANLRNEEEITIFTVDADLSPVALISEYEQVWHCVNLLADGIPTTLSNDIKADSDFEQPKKSKIDWKPEKETIKLSKSQMTDIFDFKQHCTRQYRLRSISWGQSYEFDVYFDGDINHSKRGKTWELSGAERQKVRKVLSQKTVKQFRAEKINEADKKLRAEGNLQDVYSDDTLRRVRHEALTSQDLHKNDIQDLLEKNKQQVADVENNVEGAEILLKMVENGDVIVLYVDATGSVVAAPQGIIKRIYYYAGVLALRVFDETRAIVCPLLEMVSASHNAYKFGKWLRHLRYQLSLVTSKWPIINHLVADFSFAILNAASVELNRETLIEHINNTYRRVIVGGSLESGSVVFLHICCNNFSKTAMKDINKQFPKDVSPPKIRTLLKEIIASMFN